MLLATLLAAVLAVPVTGPATNVGATSATLNGTVDAPTNAHFEYGTTTAYELTTPIQEGVPAGPVSADVSGLTVDTTYHYRIVSDEGPGEDMTFTTAGPPRVSEQRSAGVATSQATVTAAIDTRGIETSYRMQWGRTTDYGRFTPVQTLETGSATATVTLTGLSPNRTYHWRTRASNAAGTTVGADRRFKTGPLATGVTLALSRSNVRWGDELRLGGRVNGNGVRGLTVTLEQQRFPLDQGFTPVDTARTGGDGGYLFTVPQLWTTTTYRASTETEGVVISPAVIARSVVKVGRRRRHVSRIRATIEGTVLPGVHGTATLQRRIGGRWRQVRSKTVAPADELRTPYRFKVWRAKRVKRRFRVKVSPVRGAHIRGWSRPVKVKPRPRR